MLKIGSAVVRVQEGYWISEVTGSLQNVFTLSSEARRQMLESWPKRGSVEYTFKMFDVGKMKKEKEKRWKDICTIKEVVCMFSLMCVCV